MRAHGLNMTGVTGTDNAILRREGEKKKKKSDLKMFPLFLSASRDSN